MAQAPILLSRKYGAGADTKLTPDFWNQLLADIDLLLQAVQEKSAAFEEARAQLIELALFRINTALAPAFEQINEYRTGGFLVAPIADLTEVTFEEGDTSVVIHPDNRELFLQTPYVALVREANITDIALARAIAYNAETGVLSLDIVSVQGNPGPFTDVIVSATAGSVATQITFLQQITTLRDLAKDWAEKGNTDVDGAGTRSAKHWATTAQGHVASALASANTATSAAATANTAKDTAVSAAATAVAAAAEATAADPDLRILLSDMSTLADILTGAPNKVLTTDQLVLAHANVALTYAASQDWDWEDGWRRVVTMTGNLELQPPSNPKEGQFKVILFKGDSATPRSVTFDTGAGGFGGELPILNAITDSQWYSVTVECVEIVAGVPRFGAVAYRCR